MVEMAPSRQRTRALLLAGAAALLLGGCSAIADSTLRAGLGSHCVVDDDCVVGHCDSGSTAAGSNSGICIASCQSSSDCPAPASCLAALCQLPLAVGVTIGDPVSSLDSWSQNHLAGLTAAAKPLSYLTVDRNFPFAGGSALPQISALAGRDQVVVTQSVEFVPNMQLAAAANPHQLFIGVNSGTYYNQPNTPANYGSFWLHREEAWYVAGQLAAGLAQTRLGVISAGITPESIRNVNAFALGARSIKPNLVVEVRHIGYYYDAGTTKSYSYSGTMYYREEYLARLLWESGCEVVADMSYGHRPAAILDGLNATRKVTTLVSGPQFAYLDPVAGTSLKTVLGSIYESWAPLYNALFERLHRGQFDTSRPLELDLNTTDQTPLGVQVNPSFPNYLQFDAQSDDYGRALAGKQNPGPQLAIFAGPYQTNGQRDANGDGIADAAVQQLVADHAVPSDAEIAGMCFFVAGVVEKSILNVPTSPDVAALVPGGLLPGATAAETKVALHPTTEDQLALPAANSSPARLSTDCRKNAQWIYRSNG